MLEQPPSTAPPEEDTAPLPSAALLTQLSADLLRFLKAYSRRQLANALLVGVALMQNTLQLLVFWMATLAQKGYIKDPPFIFVLSTALAASIVLVIAVVLYWTKAAQE